MFDDGPYVDSSKNPDLRMRVNDQRLPIMVIESGSFESLDRLREEAKLWILGGNATAVIIICCRHVGDADQVEGEVELHTPDSNGNPVLQQTEVVIPEASPRQVREQSPRMTRRMLLGLPFSQAETRMTNLI